jgi:hypothetical protein
MCPAESFPLTSRLECSFALMELLVVIAIIAVLAGLLHTPEFHCLCSMRIFTFAILVPAARLPSSHSPSWIS